LTEYGKPYDDFSVRRTCVNERSEDATLSGESRFNVFKGLVKDAWNMDAGSNGNTPEAKPVSTYQTY